MLQFKYLKWAAILLLVFTVVLLGAVAGLVAGEALISLRALTYIQHACAWRHSSVGVEQSAGVVLFRHKRSLPLWLSASTAKMADSRPLLSRRVHMCAAGIVISVKDTKSAVRQHLL